MRIWGLYGTPQIVVPNNFQHGFGHHTDQNTPFNKWESSGRLVSNGQDIEGLNGAQRNELILAGQNQ